MKTTFSSENESRVYNVGNNTNERHLSDIDLFKLIENPNFSLLYDDISVIIRTIQ
jgi:hypothetical protein